MYGSTSCILNFRRRRKKTELILSNHQSVTFLGITAKPFAVIRDAVTLPANYLECCGFTEVLSNTEDRIVMAGCTMQMLPPWLQQTDNVYSSNFLIVSFGSCTSESGSQACCFSEYFLAQQTIWAPRTKVDFRSPNHTLSPSLYFRGADLSKLCRAKWRK